MSTTASDSCAQSRHSREVADADGGSCVGGVEASSKGDGGGDFDVVNSAVDDMSTEHSSVVRETKNNL